MAGEVGLRVGRDRFVEVNGLSVHYREAGDPGSPTLVFLHGIMGHSREWDTLVVSLANDFRVVAIDQRGHGETDWAKDYTAATMAEDLAELIQTIGPPVHVAAHSMGAMAACICAANRPDLIRRLVMIDIGPDSLTTDWALQELPVMLAGMDEARYPDVQTAVDEWLAADPLSREPLQRNYVQHNLVRRADGSLTWRFDAAGLVQFATEGVREDELWSAIDRIVAPTLLIRGEQSPLLSRSTAQEMIRRLSDGRLIEVPDAAHDVGVEQPEAVAGATLEFLTLDG